MTPLGLSEWHHNSERHLPSPFLQLYRCLLMLLENICRRHDDHQVRRQYSDALFVRHTFSQAWHYSDYYCLTNGSPKNVISPTENLPFCIAIATVQSTHRHLRNIDCLTAHTACLVCFISTVNSRSKQRKKRSLLWAALVAGTQQNLNSLYN
jgi:hypothetical protein